MWRYPELASSHQLKSVPHCRFPYSKKLESVCVNPYHYEKIENPRMSYSTSMNFLYFLEIYTTDDSFILTTIVFFYLVRDIF